MFLTQPVGKPNAVTGVVTGTVIATDPDNDALTYTVAGSPTSGTVTVEPADRRLQLLADD